MDTLDTDFNIMGFPKWEISFFKKHRQKTTIFKNRDTYKYIYVQYLHRAKNFSNRQKQIPNTKFLSYYCNNRCHSDSTLHVLLDGLETLHSNKLYIQ